MQDLYLSLNKNILKLTTLDKNTVNKASENITQTSVDGSKIKDISTFSAIVDEQLKRLTTNPKSKLKLNIIVEPQDVVLRFITINKRDGVVEDQLMSEIKSKLDDVSLEDLYFSYQKIAPFLYQFVGVRKDVMESYLELSNLLGISLGSVVPWVLLLPKLVSLNEPAIFICKRDDTQVIALSELNGIFYTGVYETEKTTEEIHAFVNELAFYKRSNPIKKVYTLNYEALSLADYEVVKIQVPSLPEDFTGYEINVLTNYMLDTNPTMSASQLNMLNLLPLPVVEKKSTAMVYVGTAVAAVFIIGLVVGGISFFGRSRDNSAQLAQNSGEGSETQVLSGTTESTQSAETSQEPAKPELKLEKKDLKIRIENGAGVSGLAARIKAKLEQSGYTVLSIDTAEENRSDTLFKFKSDKSAYNDLLKEDVKDVFGTIVVESDLGASEEYDLLIVAGTDSKL